MRNRTEIDLAFLRRIYRTSIVVYAIVSLYVWTYAGVPGWLGLTAGTAMALLSLRSVEWLATRFLAPAGAPARRVSPWWGLALVKYLLFALVVAAIVRGAEARAVNLVAFIGGLVLVHAVILLKSIGASWAGTRRSRSFTSLGER
jgi:hypothetical protein